MELEEQIARSGDLKSSTLAHPEEMRAKVEFRVSERAVFTASARMTPAGLVSAGVMIAAILISTTALVRAVRSTRR